eukprot:289414-Rhodomonas_salina.1
MLPLERILLCLPHGLEEGQRRSEGAEKERGKRGSVRGEGREEGRQGCLLYTSPSPRDRG